MHHQSILHLPSSDFLRSVFADWLDDHDEPDRAEFIRRQLAGESAVNLLKRYCAEWIAPFHIERVKTGSVWAEGVMSFAMADAYWLHHRTTVQIGFRRGFPSVIRCDSPEVALGMVREWLSRWPLEEINLHGRGRLVVTADPVTGWRSKWRVGKEEQLSPIWPTRELMLSDINDWAGNMNYESANR